jgi:hypothetical protein
MIKKDSSRFDALFGAARSKTDEPLAEDAQTSKHSDAQTSKSKDPNYQRTTLYLPKTLHRKLKAAAAEDEREMSEVMEELLKDWLEKRNT